MPGESDAERLVVLLEARIRDFERNMQKANRTAGREFGGMRGASKGATAAMEADMVRSTSRINQLLSTTSTRIGAFGKGVIGGFVGGLGAEVLIRSLGQVAKGMATIGDEAKRAGLSVKSFQELRFVAEQNRVGVDSLVDGIKELNLRADEWIATGAGPAAEAFQRLGYTVGELKEKLHDPSALFTEIIGKLEKLDKAAQIRIADEVFGGTGGEKFVQLIEQGERGIRDQIRAANDLGIVLDDAVIKKADELDRKFDAITTAVGAGLKTAIVEAADALSTFIDTFREIDKRQTDTLQTELALAQRNLDAALARKGTLFGFFDRAYDKQIPKLQQEVERLRRAVVDRTLSGMRGELERATSAVGKVDRLSNLPDKVGVVPERRQDPYFGDAPAAAERAARAFDGLDDAVSRFVDNVVRAESGGDRYAKNPNSTATGPGQFIESTWLDLFRKYYPAEAENMVRQKILDLRNDPEVSRRLIEAYARENASLLRQAGVAVNEAALQLSHFLGPQGAVNVLRAAPNTPVSQLLSPDAIAANPTILGYGATAGDVIRYAEQRTRALQGEKQVVDELSDSWDGLRETSADVSAIKAQEEAYEQMGQAGMTALQGLASALQDGKIEGHELLQILANVLQQVSGMQGMGGGFGGSLLGLIPRIFGFASGTANTGGRRGEPRGIVHGQEAVIPLPDGGRVPVALSGAAAAAQKIEVHVVSRFDADGGFNSAVEKVSRPIARGEGMSAAQEAFRHVPGSVDKRIRDQRLRGVRA